MKTLLLAQRVNHKWQAVISTNQQLQKKLFMLPPTFDEAIELSETYDDRTDIFLEQSSEFAAYHI